MDIQRRICGTQDSYAFYPITNYQNKNEESYENGSSYPTR